MAGMWLKFCGFLKHRLNSRHREQISAPPMSNPLVRPCRSFSLWFGLFIYALAASIASANVTLIPAGAAWRYLDNGTNQGTAWRGVGFNDSAWNSGNAELGYGDGDEATIVSYGPSTTS